MLCDAEGELELDPVLWGRLTHPDDLERVKRVVEEAVRRNGVERLSLIHI